MQRFWKIKKGGKRSFINWNEHRETKNERIGTKTVLRVKNIKSEKEDWPFFMTDVFSEGGSCSSARMCCDGRNATCVVQESNIILDDYIPDAYDYDTDGSCYCDHGCLDVGDCCPDFKEYCGGKKTL